MELYELKKLVSDIDYTDETFGTEDIMVLFYAMRDLHAYVSNIHAVEVEGEPIKRYAKALSESRFGPMVDQYESVVELSGLYYREVDREVIDDTIRVFMHTLGICSAVINYSVDKRSGVGEINRNISNLVPPLLRLADRFNSDIEGVAKSKFEDTDD